MVTGVNSSHNGTYLSTLQSIADRFSFRGVVYMVTRCHLGLEDQLGMEYLTMISQGKLKIKGGDAEEISVRNFLVDLLTFYPHSGETEATLETIAREEIYEAERISGNDPYEIYRANIDTFPLMNPEEERTNGRIIQQYKSERKIRQEAKETLKILQQENKKKITQGITQDISYLKTLLKMPYEVSDEQYKEARDAFVERNLRLVVSIALQYRRRNNPQLLDCIQEGNFGLFKAAERFDPLRGCRFSTCAYALIRQHISKYLHGHSETVSEPKSFKDIRKEYNKLCTVTLEKLGRLPTNTEMKASLKSSDGHSFLSEETLMLLRSRKNSHASSLSTTDEKGDVQIDVTDPKVIRPLEELALKERKEMLEVALQDLDPDSVKVICARYGLHDESTLTLKQIGAILKCTRENVRKIESDITDRIRKKLTVYEHYGIAPIRRKTGHRKNISRGRRLDVEISS
ncbi:MAG: sigma-70 family RNA polymerase sigma factor [Nanoarchaeota archaeon]|nr:sigma-70 family RNA polymerase sigma factor [Nanoarchaeota archaeon]